MKATLKYPGAKWRMNFDVGLQMELERHMPALTAKCSKPEQ